LSPLLARKWAKRCEVLLSAIMEIINRRQLTLVCRTREAAIEWCKQVGLLHRSMLCPVHGPEMKLSKGTRGVCRFRCQRGDCKKAGTEISITKGTIFETITPEKALDVLYSFAHHDSYEACRREAIQIDGDNDPIDGWTSASPTRASPPGTSSLEKPSPPRPSSSNKRSEARSAARASSIVQLDESKRKYKRGPLGARDDRRRLERSPPGALPE
jgi:hypothetical protein